MRIERTKNATRNIVFGSFMKAYQMIIPFLMRTAMIYFMGVQYLGLNSLFVLVLCQEKVQIKYNQFSLFM